MRSVGGGYDRPDLSVESEALGYCLVPRLPQAVAPGTLPLRPNPRLSGATGVRWTT